jgi:phosphosulfolactate phosphohydrolase-like enzyme
MRSEHARRLMDHGLEDDLKFCLEQSIYDVVPELDGDRLVVK